MFDGLQDAERDADPVGEERRDESIVDRNRETVSDYPKYGFAVPEGVAEVESNDIPEPRGVGHREWLVEAVVLGELRQLLLGDVELRDGPAPTPDLTTSPGTGQSHPDLIDLPARNELEEREGHQRDTEKGRNHEEDSSDDVVPKRLSP